MKQFGPALPVVAALIACATAPVAAQSLKVGSVAPAIKVAKWVKGKPVASLKDGKNVHVVEFWATWCGPCKTSIPHLTKMAQKFAGKVNFTGVSVWEREPTYVAKVAAFVKQMGNQMNYNVAVDDKPSDGFMATNWMQASGSDGIPTAFIVDTNGKIAWIGHPMEMEPVLEKVVAGTFDAVAEARRVNGERAAQQKVQAAMQSVMQLAQEGKNQEAIAALDKVIEENPALALNLEMFKFNLLLRTDEAAAMQLAAKLADGGARDKAMLLNALAWSIVDDQSQLKAPDLDLALRIAQRAVTLSKEEDAMILDTLGYAQYKKGDVKAALATQEKAMARLAALQNVPPETKKELEDRLNLYKSKAN